MSNKQSAFFKSTLKPLLNALLNALLDTSLNALLKQEVGIYVMRAVEEAAVGLNIAPSDRALIARFHTAGLLEIIRIWIEDGMRETPERLAARLSALVASSPELIERMGDTPRM